MTIKTKIYIGLFIIMLGMVCTISFQAKYIKKQKANIERLDGNVTALTTDINHFKVNDSLNAATIQSLNITISEFKDMNIEAKKTIDALNIKYKRLLKVNQTITQENQDLLLNKTIDTLILKDTIVKTVSASYRSPYLDLDIYDLGNQYQVKYESRDTIDQILENIPKKFLFIRYGTKGFKTTYVNRNPNAKIVGASDYIFKNKVWKKQ
jgi:hypothetical protein|nr:MAG TPA: hypothetical protein [Crassvirales sp.]